MSNATKIETALKALPTENVISVLYTEAGGTLLGFVLCELEDRGAITESQSDDFYSYFWNAKNKFVA